VKTKPVLSSEKEWSTRGGKKPEGDKEKARRLGKEGLVFRKNPHLITKEM